MQIRQVPTKHGIYWVKSAYTLFKLKPWAWICLFILYFAIAALIMIIPYVGSIAYMVIAPVLMGGIWLGIEKSSGGKNISEKFLLLGFKHKTKELFILGGLYVLGFFAIFLFSSMITSILLAAGFDKFGYMNILINIVMLLISILIALPMAIAFWFSPLLVVIDGIKPLEAMKLSLKAGLKNTKAFTLYSLMIFLMLIVSIFTIGLGFFIVCPLYIISVYMSYQDIFKSSEQTS